MGLPLSVVQICETPVNQVGATYSLQQVGLLHPGTPQKQLSGVKGGSCPGGLQEDASESGQWGSLSALWGTHSSTMRQ